VSDSDTTIIFILLLTILLLCLVRSGHVIDLDSQMSCGKLDVIVDM